ncbi:MAG: restriction endonuclease [Candidatus Saccharimonadales bacterium]
MPRYSRNKQATHHDHLVFGLVVLLAAVLGAYHLAPGVPAIAVGATVGILIGAAVLAFNPPSGRTYLDVDQMSGHQFERYVAWLLVRQGYAPVRLTETFDYGIDITAKKDEVIWGIQCKRYRGKVSQSAVQASVTGLAHYGCDRAMVITSGYFTQRARLLADSAKCVLVDRAELIKWINKP